MEMLVVIVIISILAALIVPQLINKADQARVAKAKSDIASLGTALQTYRLENGAYPTTDEGLNALVTQPSDAPNWKGPYITQHAVPPDPWGHPYAYQQPGPNGEDYLISSYGPSGQSGGSDNITSSDTQ
jgi:general secretion pathway protein G